MSVLYYSLPVLSVLGTVWYLRNRRGRERDGVVVFTRYPVPGKAKTRLIPAIGEEGAARTQRIMVVNCCLHMLYRLHVYEVQNEQSSTC